MKKILFLGGAPSQLPAIKYAVEAGYKVYTCDYKPDNPGHKLSHEYFNISTTDKKAVLELASDLTIDGITPFASDPAAPIAAYVSEKLRLPGSSYNSVITLSDKGLFREFLEKNDFLFPVWKIANNLDDAKDFQKHLNKNFYIKPVDSSGSKGISKVSSNEDMTNAFNFAMQFSRKGEVIIEQEIIRKGPQIHGEGYVIDGKLQFVVLGDQYFSPVNKNIPLSTTFPSIVNKEYIPNAIKLVENLISLVKYRMGGLNIEIIRDIDDKLYILELGARNGGNFMPQLAKLSTGFDLIKLNVEAVLGNYYPINYKIPDNNFATQLILHSFEDGIFNGLNIPENFKNSLIESNIYYQYGKAIKKYSGSQDVIGVQLYHFDNSDILSEFIELINSKPIVKYGF